MAQPPGGNPAASTETCSFVVDPVAQVHEQLLARDADPVRVVAVEERVPARVADELVERLDVPGERPVVARIELRVDLAALVVDLDVERRAPRGRRAALRRSGAGRARAAEQAVGEPVADGEEPPDLRARERRDGRRRRATPARCRAARRRHGVVDLLLQREDDAREGDPALRERRRPQLVARVGGDAQRDPRLVGEIRGERGEDRHGHHDEEERHAALAGPGAPHQLVLSRWRIAIRASVANRSVRPSASFSSSSSRTRDGSRAACSGVRVVHSRTHSLRCASQ